MNNSYYPHLMLHFLLKSHFIDHLLISEWNLNLRLDSEICVFHISIAEDLSHQGCNAVLLSE